MKGLFSEISKNIQKFLKKNLKADIQYCVNHWVNSSSSKGFIFKNNPLKISEFIPYLFDSPYKNPHISSEISLVELLPINADTCVCVVQFVHYNITNFHT